LLLLPFQRQAKCVGTTDSMRWRTEVKGGELSCGKWAATCWATIFLSLGNNETLRMPRSCFELS